MKLLCVTLLLVLVVHQTLANPRARRRVKHQRSILKPVPEENVVKSLETQVNLDMTTKSPEATTKSQNVTTVKNFVIEPRHERNAPHGTYTDHNKLNRCKEGEFLCDHDLCVSEEKFCDGIVNCKDGTDEDECNGVYEFEDNKKREVRQGCGGVFSHTSGTIVHPIGGGNYQNYEDCVWLINAGTPIKITFTSFQVETNYDILVIRDGNSPGSGIIEELTGHSIPPPVETSGNSAYLKFTSDYSVTFTGFELHWAPSGCGEVYTTSNGVIKHPLNGGSYENNENCIWKINAAEPIEITIVRFDLESNYDFLYVRNGPTSDSHLLGSFTGSSIPNSVQTTQNFAFLRFSSDYSVTKTGFEIRWEPATTTTTTGPSDCACGEVNRGSRIVNGVETEVNEYPWQAGMVFSGTSSVFCGGSVIGSKHVLTAAHCTQYVTDSGYSYQVLVGAHRLSSPASSQIRLEAARFIQHPNYDTSNENNDISIIELRNSINFGSTEIRPVCLPTSDDDTYDSVTATVSGWGALEYKGSSPDVLMEVDVPTMSNTKCLTFYPGGITENMLCAGYDEGGKDSCQGDSGGALYYNPGTGYTQIGVVSWGYGCAWEGNPGVYARITKYLTWISDNTASSTTCSTA